MSPKEVNYLDQGHTVSTGQNQNFNPSVLDTQCKNVLFKLSKKN